MVRIVEVDLPDINIPSDGIRLVIMQPHIQGHLTGEPFKWRADSKDAQLARIKRTLEIAKAPDFDIDRTHFTVFPECSIPGLDGVALIQDFIGLPDWPGGTIVIGGIEWLTKDEYAQLIIGSEHDELNEARNLSNNECVNCCITWVRTNNGIKRFIQPKISRAWVEHDTQHNRLFEGKCVYLFQAQMSNNAFRFFNLVCFDWINRPNTTTEGGVVDVLSAINDKWHNSPDPKPIHMVFIIEHNSEPNQSEFLSYTDKYYSTNSTKVDKSNSILFFANSAAGEKPQKKGTFGYSGIITHPNAGYRCDKTSCPQGYALQTDTLRGNARLGRYVEGLFREQGACIHSLKMNHPVFVGYRANEGCLPIEILKVFPCDDMVADPRAPRGEVPASVKWANDQIDGISTPNVNDTIRPIVHEKYDAIKNELRWSNGQSLQNQINLSTNRLYIKERHERKTRNIVVDAWGIEEEMTLETLINTTTILSCHLDSNLQIKDIASANHVNATIITADSDVIDILVIASPKTYLLHKDNFEHLKGIYTGTRQARKTLIISRADNDSQTLSRDRNIYDPKYPPLHDYRDILRCRGASTMADLTRSVSELIGAAV